MSRLCAWCKGRIPEGSRSDAKFCGKRCRQASHRFGVHGGALKLGATDRPFTIAYADPPYPGKAHLYPEKTEVDHAELVARLCRDYPDGWALSTSSEALQAVLALCPADVRVGSWHRPARHVPSAQAVDAWEPVILRGGRPLSTAVAQDLTNALHYEGRYRSFPGAIVGMKPPQFSVWLFRQMGLRRGDVFVDLFPGSGAVTRAWERYTSSSAERDASLEASDEPSSDEPSPTPADATRDAGAGRHVDELAEARRQRDEARRLVVVRDRELAIALADVARARGDLAAARADFEASRDLDATDARLDELEAHYLKGVPDEDAHERAEIEREVEEDRRKRASHCGARCGAWVCQADAGHDGAHVSLTHRATWRRGSSGDGSEARRAG